MMGRRERAGAILLEVLLSIALFTMASLVIYGSVSQGAAALERSMLRAQAADLARSAMSKLEAGLETPTSLAGPAVRWTDPSAIGSGAWDAGGAESLWELEVEVTPSPFEGLSRVRVVAIRYASRDSSVRSATYELHQLVRLGSEAEDVAGEAGDLLDAARSGAGSSRGGGR